MKSSIKFKLFLAISGLITFYVIMSWFLNSQFLVKYYYLNKESTLKLSYQHVNEVYQGKPFELLIDLEKLERTKGLDIIILDSFYNIKYSSSFKEEGFFIRPGKQHPLQAPFIQERAIIKKAFKAEKEKPVIDKSIDPRLNTEFINLVGVLSNGDYIFLSTPVAAIQESAAIANKFFSVTGLLTILIGLFIVFFFSDRFTKPILQLNEIAQRMAKLDFSKKYAVKSYDEIGELGQSINSLSDQLEKSITELKQANEQLLEDIERERRIDDMRKEFISSVSHELKTPIALIQGYAEGLKVNINENKEDKDFYCEVIIDESAKMDKLVKQLLDLSQIDAGYVHINKIDFNLAELVEYVLKKNELLIKERDICLVTQFDKDLNVNADSERIEQVIINYLINAINHCDYRKVIRVQVDRNGDKAQVRVFNTGDNIPEDLLDKIWTSFYKADQARTREYSGTGLGLSIVRAILELHQNRYGVENKKDGVEFWFEVDLTQ